MAVIGAGAYWDIHRQALPDANLITGGLIPGPAGIFRLPMKESLATRRGFRGRMGRNPDRGANGRMVGPVACHGFGCLVCCGRVLGSAGFEHC